MTADLVAWLRAQLDDDEAWALTCLPDQSWRLGIVYGTVMAGSATIVKAVDQTFAEHIAGWDPVRVLREVEAKRAILDAYDAFVERPGSRWSEYAAGEIREELELSVLPALASVYSDRPGYDESWRP